MELAVSQKNTHFLENVCKLHRNILDSLYRQIRFGREKMKIVVLIQII